ncbi:MAG TPA: hypothetical protein VKH82_16150 [Candidatus Binatia bacterium]|nr:hypothetical protein [Candidatus Binatia bacterium]
MRRSVDLVHRSARRRPQNLGGLERPYQVAGADPGDPGRGEARRQARGLAPAADAEAHVGQLHTRLALASVSPCRTR